MWDDLPFDLLANIFSYLPPDSFARAKTSCRNWHAAAKSTVNSLSPRRHPPWFLSLPTRGRPISCYAHNPVGDNWYVLPLDHINSTIRPIAAIGGLVLFRLTTTTSLQLAICNPFTKQFKPLPKLNVTRTNPAVGIVEINNSTQNYGFNVYVAGGMSEAATGGGAVYQSTVEMYDSRHDTWAVIGPMPVEFAVRLTVWTPNESVYSNGILYWMTSARAYSVMGFEIGTNRWRELSVPLADRLEFSALVPRKGRLAIAGGTCGGDGCIWELCGDDKWRLVEKVPNELRDKILGDKQSWIDIKCVGIDGEICLYRDVESGFIVWREDKDKVGWDWIEGCCWSSIKFKGKKQIHNFPIKGLLLHPDLGSSTIPFC